MPLQSSIPRLGNWHVPGQTQTQGTVITQGIPPWAGRGYNKFLYNAGTKNWLTNGGAVTHVTNVALTTGSTAHLAYVMRPLNYTTVTVAAAAGATTLTVAADPGIYSTNFNYPLPGGLTWPMNVADSGIAGSDYIMVQLADGTWLTILVTSVAGLVLTVPALPSPTGAGNVVLAGALVYYFGDAGDTDPNTNMLQPTIESAVSVSTQFQDGDGVVAALHAGDPLLFYDANATAADTLAFISGYFGKW